MEQTNTAKIFYMNESDKYQSLNHPEAINNLIHIVQPEDLRLLSINKASKILGIRFETVKKLIRTGKIKAVMTANQKFKIPYKNLVEFTNGSNSVAANQNNVIPFEVTQNKIDILIKEYLE